MDVMNAVSQTLDACLQAPRPSTCALSELDALALHDPLLASLRKSYLDAKALRVQSQQQYGVDDGMTEIAMDSEDSAWCAMQTRYLEVRGDRDAMAAAQRAMEEAAQKEKHRAAVEEERNVVSYFKSLQMMKQVREQGAADYAMLILALWMLRNTYQDLFRPNRSYVFNQAVA